MVSIQRNSCRTLSFQNGQTIVTAIGFVIAMVAANWVYTIEEAIRTEERYRTAQNQSPGKYPIDNISMNLECSYWAGGWPLKFYSRVESLDLPALHSFSMARFAANLLIWIAIAAFIAIYIRLSQGKANTEQSFAPRRIGQIKLLDLFAVLFVIAGMFGYWRLWTQQQQFEEQVAKNIVEQGGMSEVQVIAPRILKLVVPQAYLPVFARITSATLESPTDEILDKVLSVPELRSLRLGGGEYDLRKLDRLHKLPYLRELRVSGRELDGAAIAAIGSCKQLLSLNLMRTNVSNEGIEAISDLPRLRSMNLVHTSVTFSQEKKPGWSRTVQDLFLPHPGRETAADPSLGDRICAKHVIREWPELRILRCIEHDELENKNCVELEIADCPRLAKIGLDVFQRFDLRLSNLTDLEQISAELPQWETRLSAGEKTGRNTSIRKVSFRNLPKLANLQVSGNGLEEVSLQTPDLQRFGISTAYLWHLRTSSQINGTTRRQQLYDDEMSLSIRQGWVDEIGKNTGPVRADLSWLALNDVDLRPLRNNSGLRELDLSNSLVTADQLLQLSGSPSLEKLIYLGTEISGARVAKVLSNLTSIKEFRTDSRGVRILNLESHENIQRIFDVQEPRDFERLRLVSMPKLKETFEARQPLRSCELVGIPSVRGLSFQSHFPKNTKIEGLRDLEFFSAGGPTLTDKIVKEVLGCKQLKFLTLAYATKVTPEVLNQITELPELVYLSLPGCKIDTAFVQSLKKCKKLNGIVLDDTSVSDQSFDGVELAEIKQFSVNRTSVTDQLVQRFLAKPSLTKIGLAGLSISAETIEKIVKCTGLEEVDLSDMALDPKSWAALSKFDTEKKTLFLFRNAKVDFKTVKKLMIDNRAIRLDLTDAIDPITNEDSYSLSQHLLNSMSYTDLERVLDTWHPKELSERFMFEDPDSALTRAVDKNAPVRMPGEIFTFLFSPVWK